MLCHQPTREFVVAVFALIGETFLHSGRKRLSATTLCLRKAVSGLPQFVGMVNFFARGESQERMKAGVNTYRAITNMRNGVGFCVDEETEIPPRCPFDDPATFEASWREVLGVEPDVPNPWHMHTWTVWGLEGIRKECSSACCAGL